VFASSFSGLKNHPMQRLVESCGPSVAVSPSTCLNLLLPSLYHSAFERLSSFAISRRIPISEACPIPFYNTLAQTSLSL
jgi:hypothetical protein